MEKITNWQHQEPEPILDSPKLTHTFIFEHYLITICQGQLSNNRKYFKYDIFMANTPAITGNVWEGGVLGHEYSELSHALQLSNDFKKQEKAVVFYLVEKIGLDTFLAVSHEVGYNAACYNYTGHYQ